MAIRNRVVGRDYTGNQDFVTKPGGPRSRSCLGRLVGIRGAWSYSVVTNSS